MNKQDKIKELEKTITDAQAELDALNKPKRYKPEYDEIYWFRTSYGVESAPWKNSDLNNTRYKSGNCYRTSEEAQRTYDRDVLLTEMWDDCDFDADWGDEDTAKFYPYYCERRNKWEWCDVYRRRDCFDFPYYGTSQDVEAAIEKYGERMTELFIKKVGDER